MKEFLKKVVQSPAVRKAFIGLVLAIAAALGFGQLGCAELPAAQQARLDRFECQARALEPVLGDVLDASEVVQDVYAGRADLRAVLGSLKATPAEVQALVRALNACDGAPADVVPAGEAS